MKFLNINRKSGARGFTLVELVIALAVIAIIAAFGVPEYFRFLAKNRVRRAAGDLIQNIRLARTIAIKENRPYLIMFDTATNTYRMGFDGNDDGDLLDAGDDGYENGPVREIDLKGEYGYPVAYGSKAVVGPASPSTCPACEDITGVDVTFTDSSIIFNTNGTVTLGKVLLYHEDDHYAFLLKISYNTGKVDLWQWDGDKDNLDPARPVNCDSPRKQCGWTEMR